MISAGELKCNSDCMLRTRGMKNVCCKEVKTKKTEKKYDMTLGDYKCDSYCLMHNRGNREDCCKKIEPQKTEFSWANTLKKIWHNLTNG